jgi:imidazoleglycerol-phosphate dehydratase
MRRTAERITNETEVKISIGLDAGTRTVDTGCGFLDHMVDLMFHRAGMCVELKAKGDIQVDFHHLTEDCGIVIGSVLKEIAQARPCRRYGWSLLPMDGSLARIALDFSGRSGFYWEGGFPSQKCGIFDTELVPEFFRAMSRSGAMTIHMAILAADNSHHAAEAIFKGAGLAIAQALTPSELDPSTKGLWL